MSSVFVFSVILAVSQCGYSWVFNNVDYRTLGDNLLADFARSGEDYDDEIRSITREELARLRFSLIYPGTKWCGPGNVADSYDDLGTAAETDLCCRDHDNCPDVILAGDTQYNLTNDAYYSRLSCECDETFRQCLRKTTKKASNSVGLMYFNVIGTKCYRQDYKIKGCIKKGGWLGTKCLEYSYDTKSERIHQWFDVPNYY